MSDQAAAYEPLLNSDSRIFELEKKLEAASPQSFGDVQVMTYAEGATGGPGGPSGPQVIRLNEHAVNSTSYVRTLDGKLNWFTGLLKTKTDVQTVGVVQEAKTFAVREVDGDKVEWGVAVRLEIQATAFSTEAQVSVANIAAEAQLGLSNAKMDITVRGFDGWLGDLLPAPSEVDLGSYTHYLEAFKKIQSHVFGADGASHIAPTVLGILRD